MGYCGFGNGVETGRGWRHWFHATGLRGCLRLGFGPYGRADRNLERERLMKQVEILQAQLERINLRLKDLEPATGQ
jgi:hypothetical protein